MLGDKGNELALVAEETVYVEEVNGEKQIFSMHLPTSENIAYLFSMEILNDDGEAEDQLVSIVYVPAQELNVELKLDQSVYSSPEQQAVLYIENAGPTYLFFGTYYTFEMLVEDTWRVVPLNLAFNDIGLTLSPGGTYEQSIHLKELGEGKYRIVKQVNSEGMDLSATLAVEFRVE